MKKKNLPGFNEPKLSELHSIRPFYNCMIVCLILGLVQSGFRSFAQCPTFTLTTSKTDALCNGINGTATANPTAIPGNPPGPYDYQWSSMQITRTISAPAGTYTVTVTDGMSGCTETETAIISQPAPLNVVLNNPGGGNVDLTPSGGTPGYNAAISSFIGTWNGTKFLFSGLTSGLTYTYTVSDVNGCQSTSTFIAAVAIGTNPVPTLSEWGLILLPLLLLGCGAFFIWRKNAA